LGVTPDIARFEFHLDFPESPANEEFAEFIPRLLADKLTAHTFAPASHAASFTRSSPEIGFGTDMA
jgi:hypothetical protein